MKKQEKNPELLGHTSSYWEHENWPNSFDLELGLLGCILMDNGLLDHLLYLAPEHFYTPEHRTLYAAMIEMRAEGAPITPITLAPAIPGFEGCTSYLAKSFSASSIIVNPLREAPYLVELSERRAIIAACRNQVEEIYAGRKTASEHIVELNAQLQRAAAVGTTTKFLTDIQVTKNIIHKLEHPRNPYSTGLPRLDASMEGGLYPGFQYIFAGRKKMGKTTLAGTVSCNLNLRKTKHLYIAAEMGVEQIHQRNLSRLTDSLPNSFRTDYGRTDRFKDKLNTQLEASNGCIIYLNAPGITFENLQRAVAQAMSIYKITGFILDCVQLVRGKDGRKSQAEHQDDVAQWAADFGRDHGLWNILTAQMNQTGTIRGGEGCRLSCDQAFEIKAPESDPSRSDRWLEMIDTRYTEWMNVGEEASPAFIMQRNGPYFTEFDDQQLIDFGQN